MKKPGACREFQELLDELGSPAMPAGGLQRLREHAAACVDCRALLELRESLRLPSLAELERAVPDAMIAGLWRDIDSQLSAESRMRHPPRRRRQGRRYSLPAMAAALILLLAGGVYLFAELRRLHAREQALGLAIVRQEKRLDVLAQVAPPLAGLAARGPGGAQTVFLGDGAEISLAELRRALSRLPADQRLADRRELAALAADLPLLRQLMARRLLGPRALADGIQAGELLAALADPELDVELQLPRRDLERLIRHLADPQGL